MEEEESLSRCLCDGQCSESKSGEVNTEEPETADSLHHRPIDGDGSVLFSLSLPVVHNQL